MSIKKKKLVRRICQTCGKAFKIRKSRLKWGGTYCSQYCQRNRPINKIEKICTICGKPYHVWPYELKKKAPTCSVQCTKKYIQDRYNKKVKCPVCNKEFWTPKKNPLKHCSMECRNIAYNGIQKGGSYRICPTCKKEFYVEKARLLRGEGIFCSRKCRDGSPNKSVEERIQEGGLVELECAWCGKKFVRSRFFKDIQKYCSQRCYKKSRNETYIETLTRETIEKHGFEFWQEKTIKCSKRPFFVDFFLPPNIIIECDGKFWHDPEKFPKSYQKDLRKRQALRKMGYKLYILTEDEIVKDIDKIIDKIALENHILRKRNPNSVVKQRKKTLIKKMCRYCGKEFVTIPSRERSHHFCSMNCKNNYYEIQTKCRRCGKIFKIKRYAIRRRYCSLECQIFHTKERNKKKCLNCKRYFSPNPADVKRGKAKYCSRKCFIEHKYHN